MRTDKDPTDYLLAVAKKKPRLQALIDGLDQLTQESIDALTEPLWVRQALSKLKASDGQSQSMRVAALVNQAIAREEEALNAPKPTYEVRIWDCGPDYVGTDMGYNNSWKIQVETGDSFAIISEEKVKFGDSVVNIDAWNMTPLLHCSKFIGYMTLDNYKGFHRALVNQKHANLI